jgi:hypothetical protein
LDFDESRAGAEGREGWIIASGLPDEIARSSSSRIT